MFFPYSKPQLHGSMLTGVTIAFQPHGSKVKGANLASQPHEGRPVGVIMPVWHNNEVLSMKLDVHLKDVNPTRCGEDNRHICE